jgi:hypothetical protein
MGDGSDVLLGVGCKSAGLASSGCNPCVFSFAPVEDGGVIY